MMVGLISVGVVIGLTWLVWTALLHSRPLAAGHIQSFQIISDSSVSVTIAVERRDPSLPVTCRVLAQASDFQPVGEQQVPVVAASERVVEVTAAFTTLRRATAVVVKGCAVA